MALDMSARGWRVFASARNMQSEGMEELAAEGVEVRSIDELLYSGPRDTAQSAVQTIERFMIAEYITMGVCYSDSSVCLRCP